LYFSDEQDLKRILGRALARQRSCAKISQEKLAEVAGLERGYISLIERGLRMPTVETIFRLCRGLDVSPSELMSELETLLK
jgi:transcriptional regulator with XRE-family HTH domain